MDGVRQAHTFRLSITNTGPWSGVTQYSPAREFNTPPEEVIDQKWLHNQHADITEAQDGEFPGREKHGLLTCRLCSGSAVI